MYDYPAQTDHDSERYKLEIKDGRLINVARETIFELIRDIKDPEFPTTLERLNVVKLEDVKIHKITFDDTRFIDIGTPSKKPYFRTIVFRKILRAGLPLSVIDIEYAPSSYNCSMASQIGICIRYFVEKYVWGYWIRVNIKKETHLEYKKINRQINDKDGIMSAMENPNLMAIADECLVLAGDLKKKLVKSKTGEER
ncbi:MIP18 family protein galla-1 [Dictyocoela roeselum]|nr:MIP18 family protein galla-1 [Dictyocoela roeselum]